jgi:predicted outer membrane repeat protein
MKKYSLFRLLLLLLTLGGLSSQTSLQAQTIRYVKPTASGTGTGSSWANASSNLRAMVEGSNTNDQVWLAAGNHLPGGTGNTDRTISFAMKNGVAIYGGFGGTETALAQRVLTYPSSTTLSGDLGTPGVNTDNAYHVINNPAGLTNTAVLDGVVITGGNANGSTPPTNAGGGVYNDGSGSGQGCSPTFRNCTFQNNTAKQGGAMYNDANAGISSPVLTNCSFLNNTASQNGGAMYNYGSSPVLTNCSFLANTASQNGGAMYNNGQSGFTRPVLTNCSFLANTASQNGGAMYNYGSSPVLTNCSFLANTASLSGGAMFNQIVIVIEDVYGNPQPVNAYPVLTNCVLWGNGGANTIDNNGYYLIPASYSLFDNTVTGYYENSLTPPTNLTTTTSPFVSINSMALAASSPAINTGSNLAYTNANGPATDLAGNPRMVCLVDMGAVEYQIPGLSPTRLYVRAGATGTNTGLSWNDAFTDLQAALNYSCPQSLTEIWVAGGTYKPTSGTNRFFSFAMKNGVAIYGGFRGTETALAQRPSINLTTPSSTTLSGDLGTPGVNTDNAYHVINNPAGLTNTAVLDGVVITGGYANGSTAPTNAGGGVYNNGSRSGQVCNPTFRNCSFQNNTASQYGGAVYNDAYSGSSSPVLINCSFQNNTAEYGGAICNYGTPSFSSSGTSSPVMTNCSFQNNTAYNGGAIYHFSEIGSRVLAVLANCSFQNNTASRYGGAVYNFSNNSDFVLNNCVLWGNGGTNSIVNGSASVLATYSLFDNTVRGYTTSPTNLTTATSPFASLTSVALNACAGAINAGSNAANTTTTDLAGNPRIFGTTIDMGAVEFQTSGPPIPARLYVKASATGANTGLSWSDAFTDLQTALNYSGCSGNLTEIWVASGTYKPTPGTDRTISFAMKNGVAIYGGFGGTETALAQRVLTYPSSTTLSGDLGTPGVNTDNAYHVINNPAGLTNTAVLDGVVITGGYANGSTFPANAGGGVYNNGSGSGQGCSPTFRNCTFQGNTASASGGAMYNDGASGISSPALINCAFQANTASAYGGAVYNFGTSGTSSPVVTNCSFLANTASLSGGAMFNNTDNTISSNPVLTNCVLWGNGGANSIVNSSISFTVTASYSLFDNTVRGYTTSPTNLTTATSPFISSNSVALAAGSPALNTGSTAAYTAVNGPATDLAGNPRMVCLVDMGAVEYQVSPPAPARLYVKAGAAGANTGLSWNDAFTDLQAALNYSCPQSLTEIWVAGGTYKPTSGTNRFFSFAMKNGVAIYGGFRGTETALAQRPAINLTTPSSTTLSGDLGTPEVNTDNAYHVINNPPGLTNTALLDGVVITGGNANGSTTPTNAGGGVYNDGSGSGQVCSPTFRNCTFQNNTAKQGGAMYNDANAGISSPVLTNCSFLNNTASLSGGAVYNYGSSGNSDPVLNNCSFLVNTASYNGGAMYSEGSIPVLTNCSFLANSASSSGGAIYTTIGYVVLDGQVQPIRRYPILTNCVLWGNGGANSIVTSAIAFTIPASYSLFENTVTGYTTGPTNLTTTTSPFASLTSVALNACGPAINAGSNAANTTTTDLAGNPRIFGTTIDMGAVELQTTPGFQLTTQPAAASTVCAGQSVSVAVVASGAGPFTYQWYKDGTALGSQTAATLTLTNVLATAAGSYSVVVAGACNSLTSNAFTLTINGTNPTIANAGVSQTITTAMTATLGANTPSTGTGSWSVVSGPSTSQAQFNNVTNPAATFTPGGGAGSYGLVWTIRNAPCTPSSSSLTITVVLPNTTPVATANANQTATVGVSFSYTVSAFSDEIPTSLAYTASINPANGLIFNPATRIISGTPGVAGVSSVTITATDPGGLSASTIFTISVGCPLLTVTISGALTICSGQSTTLTASGSTTYAWNTAALTPTISATAGTYSVTGTTNGCSATATATVTAKTLTTITAQPASSSLVCPGGSATVSVSVSGTGPFIYQWYKGGVALTSPASATTASLTLANVQTAAAGSYSVVVTGSCNSLTSSAFSLASGPVPARLYVRAGATGANTGLSWSDAFTDLQAALTYVCSGNLTEIWIASGTYKPTPGTNRTISFAMKNGVAIYGGFVGTETSLSQRVLTYPSSTTLSGDLGTPGVNTDNAYHVINNPAGLNNTAVLDGVVIAGGSANTGTIPTNRGGGVYNNGNGQVCSPTFRNCIFQNNTATSAGGAMYNDGASGTSSPVLTNCAFQNNKTFGDGGAMYNDGAYGSSNPVLTNCAFQSNTATSNGGAMYLYGNSSGSSSPVLTNCSFQGNSASQSGGAIFNFSFGSNIPVLTNCVLWGNGGANTIINSSISFTVTASYSLFDNTVTGYTTGPTNQTTTTSPFASTAITQLAMGSPAINAGNSLSYTAAGGSATDLAGNVRIQNGTIDMGAYEFSLPTDLTLLLYVTPSLAYSTTVGSVVVDVFEINLAPTTGTITVHITKTPQLSLSFNPTATSLAGKPVQNSGWSFDGTSSPDAYILTTTQPIAAGGKRSIGLSSVLTPGNTKGKVSVTATLVGSSGGEVTMTNNTDADQLEYFSK